MYKKIYRQGGGLAEQGYRAQIREASRKAIEDWNRRTKGEVAQKVRTPVRKPPISQRIKKGISSLVPDTYRNLRTIPLTGIDVGTKALLNKYLPWLSGDIKPSYIRTPEMDQQVSDAIMRQREGKGPGSGSLGYSDWGVKEAPLTGGYLGPGDMLYGTPGLANALTLGKIDYDIDPVTNKITFPQGGAYDFEIEESPPHLRFIYDALKDYGGDVSPKNLYYKPGQAAQQLGDIEAQVDPYDQGLASLPEAQAEKGKLAEPGTNITTQLSPEDEGKIIDYKRYVVTVTGAPGYSEFFDPTFSGNKAWNQSPGNPGYIVYKDKPLVNREAQVTDATQLQPTGFEGTGYGELASLPKAQDALTREQFEKTLPEGYRPLNVTYNAYWDKYGTKPYKDIQKERGETRRDMYSGMPVILSPKDADFFQMYFKGPVYDLHTRPGKHRDEVMSKRYSPPVDPWWDQYQQQPTGQPTGFEGTGYGQFSPQPVNLPIQSQDALVKYTPPFTGGGMIPETQMIPANDPRITGPFTVKSPTGPMPLGMPVVPGGPKL